jgi:hypothetical protein
MVANRDNPRTRCAYENVLHEFTMASGIEQAVEFRIDTRSHVLA